MCAVGTGDDRGVHDRVEIRTEDPGTTLAAVSSYFHRHGGIDAIGVAAFGPVDLRTGRITSTPKPGWSGVDVAGHLRREHPGAVIGLETDVGAAALAEGKWGAARGVETFVYVTVGTGIGGAAVVNGAPLHGLMHPEMGHMRIPHDERADPFAGSCPFHGDCWEGLASGPAIEARWGKAPGDLPADHPAWELETRYLASGIANLVCALSPEVVVVGGGVMRRRPSPAAVEAGVRSQLNGYVDAPPVVRAALGDDAGVAGALVVARRSL